MASRFEPRLEKSPYLAAGRFTAADVAVGYALMLAGFLGLDSRFTPAVAAYWQRLRQREGHRRALRAQDNAAREQGVATPQVERVRWGDEPGNDDSESPPVDLLARYPGPFVLFVSSISLHKNQTLLFQVWRRLIERHGGGVPTLVLVGRHDFITPPRQAERLKASLSRTRLVTFEESGHYPWVEEPDMFFATVQGWLTEQR